MDDAKQTQKRSTKMFKSSSELNHPDLDEDAVDPRADYATSYVVTPQQSLSYFSSQLKSINAFIFSDFSILLR